MTSDPVLVDAHFTSSGLSSLVSVSSLFPFFYVSEFSNHAILWGVVHCKLCTSFYWHNFLHCVLWRYYQDIHSITSSCILSCFYLPWFDSKILDILRYHDVHHKWDTLSYLSSHCLLPPLWHESWDLNFVDLLRCFKGFSSYWPTASLEKRRSLTRTILSSMKFVKSINPGSLIWTFLISCTFLFRLSCKYPGIFAKIIQNPLDLVYPMDFDYHTPNSGTLLGS